MTTKSVPPSIHETAFDCPHCGAYTTQRWFDLYAESISDDQKTPYLPDTAFEKSVIEATDIEKDERNKLLSWYKDMNNGSIIMEENKGEYIYYKSHNIYLSECYNCGKIAVWIHDRLLSPPKKGGAQPNQDLPEDVIRDFEEARSILDLSPRGSAALLRLAIQKLCVSLGEKGRNIDDDIAALVSKGLNPLIQKSLDIVRVIGNEAVHPGVIDLNDDRDTAEKLFGLINVIAEQMITIPQSVDTMYGSLPENKRKAIEARNDKAKGKQPE